jgi:23S rRNA pseudouridine2605 synthase
MTLIRLQKFLSQAGICSRRKGETLILQGVVQVNGVSVTELGTKIDPEKDRVTVRGKPVESEQAPVYIALNKPRGYVTSCRQPGEKIVLDLINISERIFPVGRLDKDSTGLLLLTNDGRLHHMLSHPSYDHEKEYDVSVANPLSDSAIRRIEKGMPILGSKTRPAVVKRLSPRRFQITLKEGRNRQIRRMVGKVGNQIIRLKRIRIANVKLVRLPLGGWRYLSAKEIKTLTGFHP